MSPGKAVSGGFSFLADLKGAELQSIALLTGLSTGGTKAEIRARLNASLSRKRILKDDESKGRLVRLDDISASAGQNGGDGDKGPHRILSVDMGIRNLAYCTLSLDTAWVHSCPKDKLYLTRPITQILQWRRSALSTLDPAAEEDAEKTSLASSDNSSMLSSPVTKELFTPPHLAPVALRVLHDLVLRPSHNQGPPHTVLIEKQRWRSGGGAAVQEWTLRVNSLEAMLWAGLEVLRGAGLWSGDVHTVDPKTVGRFWVPEGLESGKKGKEMKVNVVEGWFDDESGAEELICCGHQASHTRKAFMRERNPSRRRVKNTKSLDELGNLSGQAVTKRDDLADCLLQGMAWIRWEENRRAITSGHPPTELVQPK